MDTGAIKEALTRKVGPLPVVAWVGIGAGAFLVVRKLTGSGASSAFEVSTGSGTNFEASGSGSGGTSSSTTPTTTPPTTKPKSLWGSDIPKTISLIFSSASAAALFKKFKVDYGTTINMADLRALLKKMGINYGKTVDPADLVKAGIAKVATPGTTPQTVISKGVTGTFSTPVVGVPDYTIASSRAVSFAQNAWSGTAPTVDAVSDVRTMQVGKLPASLS